MNKITDNSMPSQNSIQIGKRTFKVELVTDPKTKQATYILEGNRQSKYG